jgi:thioredoxin-related protein
MQKVASLILFFLITSIVFTACKKKVPVTPLDEYKVTVIHEDFDGALNLASTNDKNMCLMLHADWCTICKTFIRDVLTEEEVEQAIKSKIVFALIDGDKDYGKTYFNQYNAHGFPTFLILDKHGVEIARNGGGLSKSEFLTWVNAYLK